MTAMASQSPVEEAARVHLTGEGELASFFGNGTISTIRYRYRFAFRPAFARTPASLFSFPASGPTPLPPPIAPLKLQPHKASTTHFKASRTGKSELSNQRLMSSRCSRGGVPAIAPAPASCPPCFLSLTGCRR